MPRGDRTGPTGMGPMTGRGAGYCTGYGVSGFANPAFGRGFGSGRGGGRGFGGGGWGRRNWFRAAGMPGWMGLGGSAAPYQAPDAKAEKQMLKGQADAIRAELEAIDKRLAELEAGSASK